MKKVLLFLVLFLNLFIFSLSVNAKPVELDPGDPTIDRIDGPCPYYIGDHRAYDLKPAIITGQSTFTGFYGFFYCNCGYFVLASGYPDTGGPVGYYAFPTDVEFIGCYFGVMYFGLIEGGTVKYSSASSLPGTDFYNCTEDCPDPCLFGMFQ